jgi:uncharacterized protein YukJ
MGIPNYSLLKGDPQPGSVSGSNPHFRIPVNTASGSYTIDVNIESTDGSEVLYAVLQNTPPPNADVLLALPDGDNPPAGIAIDYVRTTINGAPMITKDAMTLLPIGGSSDLQDQIVTVVNQAIQDDGGLIYAFGSFYADSNGVQGIHDIHMNQGNPSGSFSKDNGTFQDGALFVYLPATLTWISVFIAFQTESWNTDDQGNPM